MSKRTNLVGLMIGLLGVAGLTNAALGGGDACRKAAVAFSEVEGSPIYVGPMAGRPAVGDMNGDQHLDLVVACGTCCGDKPSPKSGHLFVLLGDGRGRFAPTAGSPLVIGPSVRKVALGDVDRDGDLDAVAAEHDVAAVTILKNDGKGKLAPTPESPVATAQTQRPHTHDVVLGDVNQDKKLDLLTTNVNDGTVSVLLGDGRGAFAPAPASPVQVGRGPYDAIVLADLDGDGLLDFATPNVGGNKVDVLKGDGAGGFVRVPGAPFPVGQRPGYLIAADFDGDRRLDLLATHDDVGLLAVLKNEPMRGDDAGPAFRSIDGSPFALPAPTWGIDAADFDGDGKIDLVAAALEGPSPRIFFGDGNGGFAAAESVKLKAGDRSDYVIAADLDRDGRSDLVVSNYGSGDLSVFLAKH